MLTKGAKILTPQMIKSVLSYIETTRDPVRNRCIFLLSVKGTLRSAEIAGLTWSNVCDAEGNLIDHMEITNDIAKGKCGGGKIPLAPDLKKALSVLLNETKTKKGFGLDCNVIRTERSKKTSPSVIVQLFGRWYRNLGFEGCSSHSGRKTAITNLAKKIHMVGGTLNDVRDLARHRSIQTTQLYIAGDELAKRKVMDIL